MTERLYYRDSFLYEFDAEVRDVRRGENGRATLVLNRSAFYPTSGGQVYDTGWITPEQSDGTKLRVAEVADGEDGEVVHYLEAMPDNLHPGTPIHGEIERERRRDHMQQHSAQHVLSAAFVRLHDMATVSFHMAADYCSIDLATQVLTKSQVEAAEKLANEVVLEARPVDVRFVSRGQAEKLGLRKIPPAERDELRLIDIRDFDLSACGGTHVSHTGQIGCILLRKAVKVRQGWRMEFVAGQRAVATARQDFTTLSETAAQFSAQLYELPQHARKSLDEFKSLRKLQEQFAKELAAVVAENLLARAAERNGRKVIVQAFPDRDAAFVKLLAQQLSRHDGVIALLGATHMQAALVFAQSSGLTEDMGATMQRTLAQFSGRGGGGKDMAQGGLPKPEDIEPALLAAAEMLNKK